MLKINKKIAQSTLEYAILVIVIVAALLTIQVYFKRSVQGRLRASADDVGSQFSTAGRVSVYTDTWGNSLEESGGVLGRGVQQSTIQSTNWTRKREIINLDAPSANTEYWGNAALGNTGP